MEWSYFLGSFLGLYLLVMGLFLITRPHILAESIDSLFKNYGLICFTGVFLTLFGLFLVLSHTVWEMSWRGLITLLSYLILFKGISRIYFPTWGRDTALKIAHTNMRLYVGVAVLVIGFYLTYVTLLAPFFGRG